MKTLQKIIISISIIIVVIIIVVLIWFKTNIISKSEVKRIIANDMNASISTIHFDDIDLELSKEYYEVELYYDKKEYSYKINCKTGVIIYTDFKLNSVTEDSSNNTIIDNQNNSDNYLTLEQVKAIALNYIGTSEDDVTFKKIVKDYEDGELVYDLELIYNGYIYEFEISSVDGKIIEYDKELNHQ